MITIDQLKRFAGLEDQDLVDGINATLERFEINTARRTRYFITHAFVETKGFTAFSEDLWYKTPEVLVTNWPRRFTMDSANKALAYAPEYLKNPEKLANCVYAGRLGNGDTASGDGWRFRGRGGFHLTFRQNYSDYSRKMYGDDRCVVDPDLVMRPHDAMNSAGWFWDNRRLNQLADADEFTKTTVIINGSDRTVQTRLKALNRANVIF